MLIIATCCGTGLPVWLARCDEARCAAGAYGGGGGAEDGATGWGCAADIGGLIPKEGVWFEG